MRLEVRKKRASRSARINGLVFNNDEAKFEPRYYPIRKWATCHDPILVLVLRTYPAESALPIYQHIPTCGTYIRNSEFHKDAFTCWVAMSMNMNIKDDNSITIRGNAKCD